MRSFLLPCVAASVAACLGSEPPHETAHYGVLGVDGYGTEENPVILEVVPVSAADPIPEPEALMPPEALEGELWVPAQQFDPATGDGFGLRVVPQQPDAAAGVVPILLVVAEGGVLVGTFLETPAGQRLLIQGAAATTAVVAMIAIPWRRLANDAGQLFDRVMASLHASSAVLASQAQVVVDRVPYAVPLEAVEKTSWQPDSCKGIDLLWFGLAGPTTSMTVMQQGRDICVFPRLFVEAKRTTTVRVLNSAPLPVTLIVPTSVPPVYLPMAAGPAPGERPATFPLFTPGFLTPQSRSPIALAFVP